MILLKTVKEEYEAEVIINKSRFIGILIPVFDKENVNELILNIRNKYKNATHYCYGYIIGSFEKCDDNGEPQGTAGMPILNVLKFNGLTNVLCVVIRYFGGIKLGAGGLVRAYSLITKEVIKKSVICNYSLGYYIVFKFDYDNLKNVDFLLKGFEITKIFNEKIIYKFKIKESDFNLLEGKLLKYGAVIEKKVSFVC